MRLDKRLLPGSKQMGLIFGVEPQTILRWQSSDNPTFTNVEILTRGKRSKWVYQPEHILEGVINLRYDLENVEFVLTRINNLSDLSPEFKSEATRLLNEHIKPIRPTSR